MLKLKWSTGNLLCLSSTANAAGGDFVPYFQHTVDTLKIYLIHVETEDERKVQIQAVGR